jgi:CheY-like chemotaxis protein
MPQYADMPIILLTAKRLELDVEALKAEYGISRVFPKPFSPSELIEFVAGLLASTVG